MLSGGRLFEGSIESRVVGTAGKSGTDGVRTEEGR
jgi:hypothetical protein